MSEQNKPPLARAIQSLQDCVNAMNHPDEEIAAFCICDNSRGAITEFLVSFLEYKSVPFNKNDSIADLIAKCVKIDPEFKTVNLSCIKCAKMTKVEADKKHCFDLDNVNDCFNQACKIKNLIIGNLEVQEDELTFPRET